MMIVVNAAVVVFVVVWNDVFCYGFGFVSRNGCCLVSSTGLQKNSRMREKCSRCNSGMGVAVRGVEVSTATVAFYERPGNG